MGSFELSAARSNPDGGKEIVGVATANQTVETFPCQKPPGATPSAAS